MGLLDYYRQFEGMSEEEVNQGLREEAAERRRKALARVETLDLSLTTWPELPHPRIVNTITYVAISGPASLPAPARFDLRNELAERHGVEPGRLILGNGAAELLNSATRALIAPGQQLLTSWPSYPLYPIMARRAHGGAVPVTGGVDALLEAAHEPDARVVALASPNDPTGELLHSGELERLLDGLPEGVALLLDEALVEFADAQPTDSSLELLEDHPRLLVFRSFSKAWGLAGLRVGYAIGGPGSEDLLAELEPDLGVSEVSQAGALEAVRSCSELLERRVAEIAQERARLTAALRERGLRCRRQPGELRVGGTSASRRRRAGRAAGPRGRARRRRRGARRAAARAHRSARQRRHRAAAAARSRRRVAQAQPAEPDWRSSAPVVPSRILRQALTDSVSVSKWSTTWRTRLAGDLKPVALGDLLVAVVFAGQLLGHRLEAVAGDLDARGEVHHRGLEHQLVAWARARSARCRPRDSAPPSVLASSCRRWWATQLEGLVADLREAHVGDSARAHARSAS